MKIGEFDALTGEQIIRDATPEEIAAREAEIAQWAIEKQERIAKAEQLKSQKIAAYEKLGLTQEEIDALVPPALTSQVDPSHFAGPTA